MLWEYKGDVVWAFGWHAPPTDVVTAALGAPHLKVEVASTRRFCHDMQHGGMFNAAWVGLLRKAEGTCASPLGGDGEVAGATCMQCTTLATLLQEFDGVF